MTSTEQVTFFDLDTAAIGRPITRLGISFFPVYLMNNELPRILTSFPTVCSIGELDDPSVPTWTVTNGTGHPLLLVEGEQFVGGDQNRTINVSVLVPGDSTMEIPVSCLEAGRWGRRSGFESGADFMPGPTFTHRRVRRASNLAVAEQAGSVRARRGDQGAVWRSIDDSLGELNVHARTSAMADADAVFEQEPERFDAAEELCKLGPLPRQCGVVITHGPRVVATELFGAEELLQYHWAALVRSYLLEASTNTGRPSADRVLRTLRDTSQTACTLSPGLGLGVERHFRNRRAVGQALTIENSIVYACVLSR